VLIVDGLDEGTWAAVMGYSIVSLLPATPWHGMRVIVAGRPNPPIPADVSQHHPLRDTGIIRLLSSSDAAHFTRQQAATELDRLLDGDAVHRDTLALITAAGDGLSVPELGRPDNDPANSSRPAAAGSGACGSWRRWSTSGLPGSGTCCSRTSRTRPDTSPTGRQPDRWAGHDRHPAGAGLPS
jgi:hypothetical protein